VHDHLDAGRNDHQGAEHTVLHATLHARLLDRASHTIAHIMRLLHGLPPYGPATAQPDLRHPRSVARGCADVSASQKHRESDANMAQFFFKRGKPLAAVRCLEAALQHQVRQTPISAHRRAGTEACTYARMLQQPRCTHTHIQLYAYR
jgi:hypothetical protein